jgi:AbrB family looped-hinge helix DNA binding protein
MKQIVTTITKAGQITLPAEVRRILGVKVRDRVAFAIDNGRVTIVPMKYTIRSAAGSVGPPTTTEDLDRRIREAKEERAERIVSKLSRE